MKKTSLVLLAGFSALTLASVGCDPNSGQKPRGKVTQSTRGGLKKGQAGGSSTVPVDQSMAKATQLAISQPETVESTKLDEHLTKILQGSKVIQRSQLPEGTYHAKQIIQYLRYLPLKETDQKKQLAIYSSFEVNRDANGAFEVKPLDTLSTSVITMSDQSIRTVPLQFKLDKTGLFSSQLIRIGSFLTKGKLESKAAPAQGDAVDILMSMDALKASANSSTSTTTQPTQTYKIYQKGPQILVSVEEVTDSASGNRFSLGIFIYEKQTETAAVAATPAAVAAPEASGAAASAAKE